MTEVARRGAAQAVEARRCSVCAAQSRAVFDVLVSLQVALVQSAEARERFGSSRGLCAFHMWLLQQIGDSLSLSKAFAPVAKMWAAHLRRLAEAPVDEVAASITSAIPSAGTCEACALQQEVGTARLRELVAAIATSHGRCQFERGAGVCVSHLASALEAAPSVEVARFLLVDHARRLDEVRRNLDGYVTKREGGQREQITDRELDAWRQALGLLAGERTIHWFRSHERVPGGAG